MYLFKLHNFKQAHYSLWISVTHPGSVYFASWTKFYTFLFFPWPILINSNSVVPAPKEFILKFLCAEELLTLINQLPISDVLEGAWQICYMENHGFNTCVCHWLWNKFQSLRDLSLFQSFLFGDICIKFKTSVNLLEVFENSVVCVVNMFFSTLFFQITWTMKNINTIGDLDRILNIAQHEYRTDLIFFLQRWKRNKTIQIKATWSGGRRTSFQTWQHELSYEPPKAPVPQFTEKKKSYISTLSFLQYPPSTFARDA